MQDTNSQPDEIVIAMDEELRRPGCALLQAAMGGDVSFVTQHFPVESWLTAPTTKMRLFSARRATWEKVATELVERYA